MREYMEILRRHASSETSYDIVFRHSLEVLAKSLEIVARKKLYNQVDLDLVLSGALLHDIGALDFIEHAQRREEYIRHGIEGAQMLEKEGLIREASIAKRHTGSGLTKEEIVSNGWNLPAEDLLPISLEEKLVCYADKFSSKTPGKKDTLESIEAEFRTYGEGPYRRFVELKDMFE